MSDTWAGVLAISMAMQALVQIGVLVGLLLAVRRIAASVAVTQQRVEGLVDDVQDQVGAVVTDVRGVTGQVSQMVGDVRDRAHRVEDSLRAAGQRVASAVESVPRPVKQSVPAALAIFAAYRTFRAAQQRVREHRAQQAADDMYIAS